MEETPRNKRPYTKPTVTRVDLMSHEVALAVCKTAQRQTQPNTTGTCTQGGFNACKTSTSAS